MTKKRIDQLLVEQHLASSLPQAIALVRAGLVQVNQQTVINPAQLFASKAMIAVKQSASYVSRGGHKLAAALERFQLQPADAICADVGASTGGFTDVLLQHQAKRVYAIDVGYGDFAWKLRQDSRVVLMERTNARKLTQLPEPIGLTVIDVSFISLRLILPAAKAWAEPAADFVALVKPQFEAPKDHVDSGGIVRDPLVHRQVLAELLTWGEQANFNLNGLIPSPILGAKGNREFLLHLSHGRPTPTVDVLEAIEACLY